MSELPIKINKIDCFCCFLKKELEDNFSSNADAININHHFKHHLHQLFYPSRLQLKEQSTPVKDFDWDFKHVDDYFYGV